MLLSFWSIGSWGGSGVCSFAGGAIATYIGWRWIFIFSIIFAVLGLFLLKDTPESKAKSTGKFKFDFTGLINLYCDNDRIEFFITLGADLAGQTIKSLVL